MDSDRSQGGSRSPSPLYHAAATVTSPMKNNHHLTHNSTSISTSSSASSSCSNATNSKCVNPQFTIEYILSNAMAAAAASKQYSTSHPDCQQDLGVKAPPPPQALQSPPPLPLLPPTMEQLNFENQQRANLMAAAAASSKLTNGPDHLLAYQHQQQLVPSDNVDGKFNQTHPNFLYLMACMFLQQQQQQQQQAAVAAAIAASSQNQQEQLAGQRRELMGEHLARSPLDSLAILERLTGAASGLDLAARSIQASNAITANGKQHLARMAAANSRHQPYPQQQQQQQQQPPAYFGPNILSGAGVGNNPIGAQRHLQAHPHSNNTTTSHHRTQTHHEFPLVPAALKFLSGTGGGVGHHLPQADGTAVKSNSSIGTKQVAANQGGIGKSFAPSPLLQPRQHNHARQLSTTGGQMLQSAAATTAATAVPAISSTTAVAAPTAPGNTSNRQHVDKLDNLKPAHSYIGLIGMCIISSPEKRMVLNDIYQFILDNYPYYRNRGSGWRNSVRHNLSLNECFQKAGRAANGKGHYWTIHPANMEDFMNGDFRRRRAQRKVRRFNNMDVPSDESEDESVEDANKPPLPEHFKRSLAMHRSLELAGATSYLNHHGHHLASGHHHIPHLTAHNLQNQQHRTKAVDFMTAVAGAAAVASQQQQQQHQSKQAAFSTNTRSCASPGLPLPAPDGNSPVTASGLFQRSQEL